MLLEEAVKSQFRTRFENASLHQIYVGVCNVVKEAIIDNWISTQQWILGYAAPISATATPAR